LVVKKDFAIELRSYEVLSTTVFFAVSCVAIFSFAFVKEGEAAYPDAAAGILWIAIEFAGTLALGRTFERERYGETLKALLLAPASRAAIYMGKMLGIVALLAVCELLLVPLVALLFRSRLFAQPALLVALLLAGTIGFAVVGSLFAAMLVRARTRDVMLPILLYPMTVPLMIAGVRGTVAMTQTPVDQPSAIMWIVLLLCMDAVFLILALWTFEPLMT